MAAIPEYDVGDSPRFTVEFRNADGVPADPTVVTAKVQDPAATETTPTATKLATGIYYIDIDITASGTWYARMVGTGAVKAACEAKFTARPTQF